MISEATTYECDGPDCDKLVVISKTHPAFGPSRVADWTLLLSGKCYCSIKCFVDDSTEPGVKLT